MPVRQNTEVPGSDSEAEFLTSALRRKKLDLGTDQEDLGVTRETGPLYPERASIFDNLFALLSVGTFVADIGMDIVVARQYFLDRNYWWFSLTVTFIVIPSIILQVFSSRWYREDDVGQSVSSCALHIILLGPIERYLNAFYYGCKTYVTKEVNPFDYLRYMTEWRDITMLRLFEAFLESGPQVVLQLYVLVTLNKFIPEKDWQTAVAAISSIVSIAWAIASYSHALRLCCAIKGLSWFGYIFQIFYRLFMVASRVAALVLFASVFKAWIFLVVGIHFTAMFIWLSLEKSYFCPAESKVCESLLEKGFNSVISVIYVFCFINIHEGATRHRILAYYTVFFAENLVLTAFWFPNRTIHGALMYSAFGVVIGGFALGVMSMLFYYKYFHPNQDITEGWLPWKCCTKEVSTSNGTPSPEPEPNNGNSEEEHEPPKVRKIDIPKSIKLKGGNTSWRHSLLASSPGTPIDIELPFRFNQHTYSPSKSDLTHSLDVIGHDSISAGSRGHENLEDELELQVRPCNSRSRKSGGLKTPITLERKYPTDSENTSMETLIRSEVNHNSNIYPCNSKLCYSTFHSSKRNNISDRRGESMDDIIEDASASNSDDIRFLGSKSAPVYSSRDHYSLAGVSPGTSLSELSREHNLPQVPRSDDSCFESEASCVSSVVPKRYNHANEPKSYGLLNQEGVLSPYSPHRSPQPFAFPVDDSQFSQDTDSSSRSGYSADTEKALLREIGKGPSNSKRRGRSKSLPDKNAIRQSVVEWMVDRLQMDRVKDAIRRPHSDMGNYTVTVNINGADYYTSLV